ncbi:hypothetical protein KCP71_15400 [Salmonella enterica subsp. enterica]|nr:hypothetical protein KCP71_15400 [Salmonella enterica subsp. enterica]
MILFTALIRSACDLRQSWVKVVVRAAVGSVSDAMDVTSRPQGLMYRAGSLVLAGGRLTRRMRWTRSLGRTSEVRR